MLTELRAGLCLISAALGLLLPGSVLAVQESTPQSIRVTSGAVHHHSTGRSWGRFFAYSSPVDLTGGGVAGNQVYIFSVVDYACQFGQPGQESGGPLACPTPPNPIVTRATNGNPADGIDNPSVNTDGTIIAFEAFGTYAGKCTGAAAKHRQVFIQNLATNEIKAVTCDVDGDASAPSLNEAGGAVTFVSTASKTGNPAGIAQVYVFQYTTDNPQKKTGLTAITYGLYALGTGPSDAPMMNQLGDHVAFESRADLLGDGHDTGRWNIFWFDRQLEQIFQVTNGNGDSKDPYIEEKRPGGIFFDSAATDLQGTAGIPGGRQIYRANIKDAASFPPLAQYTAGGGGANPGNCWMPAVEPNGLKVAFFCDGDLLLNGTTGPRIFAIDFKDPAHQVLYQITGRGTPGPRLGASLGAWFITFDSDDDVGGYGVCGRPDLDHDVRLSALHRGRPRAPRRDADRPEARRATAWQPERQLLGRRRLLGRHLRRWTGLHPRAGARRVPVRAWQSVPGWRVDVPSGQVRAHGPAQL